MTTRSARRGRLRAIGVPAAVVLCALALNACSSGTSAPGGSSLGAPPQISAPLATSVVTSDGTWATLPMGHLDDPLNTFWQLFHRPTGKSSWSDQVGATAVATNGGLVLASPSGGRAVLVGVLPSHKLTFSPLLFSSDGGGSWSNGLVTEGLLQQRDALAVGPSGVALALAGTHDQTEVLESGGNLSTWSPLTSQQALSATAAGSACGLQAITALGYRGADPVVGGTCGRAGVTGILSLNNGRWALDGPPLPLGLGGGRAETLSLEPTRSGALSAVLAVADGSDSALVAAWSSGPDGRWTTSEPLTLPAGESVASVGTDGATRTFVLLSAPSGTESVDVVGPDVAWSPLPSPPTGTATLALGPGTTADALAGNGTQLTVWAFAPGSHTWAKTQVIHVPIAFGSSS